MKGIQDLTEGMGWAPWLALALAVSCFARALYDGCRAFVMSVIKETGATGGGSPFLAELVATDSPTRYVWMTLGWTTAGVALGFVSYQFWS